MPLPARGADLDDEALVGLQLLERLRRVEARHAVDVAGQQRGHARGRVVDEAEGHALELDRLGVAKAVPLGQRDRVALLPVLEAERPGADRLGRGRRPAVFGCRITAVFSPMRNRKLPSALFSVRITVCGSGALIELMLSNTAPLALLVLFSSFARSKLNFTADESKRLAVVELDALLQLEGVAAAVGVHGPALGQQRRDRAVDVDLGQAFQHVVVHDLADRRGRRDGRIEARRLQHHGQRDAVFLALCEGQRRGQCGGQCERGERRAAVQCHRELLSASRCGWCPNSRRTARRANPSQMAPSDPPGAMAPARPAHHRRAGRQAGCTTGDSACGAAASSVRV